MRKKSLPPNLRIVTSRMQIWKKYHPLLEMREACCKLINDIFVSPAVSRGDTKGSLLRHLSVCPSVRPSSRLSCLSRFSRHTSLFCNNSSSTYTTEMKLHIWIYLGERKCHAQFLSYSPLSIFWKSLGRWHVFRGTPNSSLFWCFRRTTTTYFWRNVVKLILSLKMKLTRSVCNHIANLRISDYVKARRLYDLIGLFRVYM